MFFPHSPGLAVDTGPFTSATQLHAVHLHGVTATDVESILRGEPPETLDEETNAIYHLARHDIIMNLVAL